MKTLIAFVLGCSVAALGQNAGPSVEHHHHSGSVDSRGDMAMRFSHSDTTHHFRLLADGGAIQITANDAADQRSVAAIRDHLRQIAERFAAGDFSAPMFIHDRVPPGVPELRRAKTDIGYLFADIPSGGQIRIRSSNRDAVQAIHDFLRFQIADHHTGDTTTVAMP